MPDPTRDNSSKRELVEIRYYVYTKTGREKIATWNIRARTWHSKAPNKWDEVMIIAVEWTRLERTTMRRKGGK